MIHLIILVILIDFQSVAASCNNPNATDIEVIHYFNQKIDDVIVHTPKDKWTELKLCHCKHGFITTLKPSTCIPIPGYCSKYKPCGDRGVCVESSSPATGFFYQCKCYPAFTGRLCEIKYNPCEGDTCQNGRCERDPSNHLLGYKCACDHNKDYIFNVTLMKNGSVSAKCDPFDRCTIK
jgi:hypothetical protein